jgi:phosphoserine phosphatase
MEGDTKFEEALAARLDIIKPSRAAIEKCLKDYPLQRSPGMDRLVEVLNERGVDVYFISGGFRIMIEPVAKELCVSKTNIIANTIFFDENTQDGDYLGFCREEPTSADMGKPKAVQQIKDEFGYDTIVMVGDGATDAQAKPPADAFIGFGGVAVREAVREKACWYIRNFQDMIEVIEKFGKKK